MQSHALSFGGWFARRQAACSRCRQAFASRRSRATERTAERTASKRGALTGGRPRITVSQRRVPARKLRRLRFQWAIARSLARALLARDSVVATVVVAVTVVFVVELELAPLLDPAAAIAWGEAAGWDGRAFRVYYAAGALLTAPLLGAGSLLLAGRRRAAPVALVFVGLALGISLAMPVHGAFAADGIPAGQDHLAFLPARLLAIAANVLGTLAVVVVALRSFRQRPLGNGLIIAGIAAAATGSGLSGLGAAGSAIGIAIGAALLYAGFVVPAHISALSWPRTAPR